MWGGDRTRGGGGDKDGMGEHRNDAIVTRTSLEGRRTESQAGTGVLERVGVLAVVVGDGQLAGEPGQLPGAGAGKGRWDKFGKLLRPRIERSKSLSSTMIDTTTTTTTDSSNKGKGGGKMSLAFKGVDVVARPVQRLSRTQSPRPRAISLPARTRSSDSSCESLDRYEIPGGGYREPRTHAFAETFAGKYTWQHRPVGLIGLSQLDSTEELSDPAQRQGSESTTGEAPGSDSTDGSTTTSSLPSARQHLPPRGLQLAIATSSPVAMTRSRRSYSGGDELLRVRVITTRAQRSLSGGGSDELPSEEFLRKADLAKTRTNRASSTGSLTQLSEELLRNAEAARVVTRTHRAHSSAGSEEPLSEEFMRKTETEDPYAFAPGFGRPQGIETMWSDGGQEKSPKHSKSESTDDLYAFAPGFGRPKGIEHLDDPSSGEYAKSPTSPSDSESIEHVIPSVTGDGRRRLSLKDVPFFSAKRKDLASLQQQQQQPQPPQQHGQPQQQPPPPPYQPKGNI